MKNSVFIKFSFVTVFLIVILISCDDTKISDLPTIPQTNVSYSEHIQPLFDLDCNSSGCHNDGDHAGGLSLTNWANTTASYLVVAPGHPENSQLVLAVQGNSTYPMPPVGYQVLSQDQIDGIYTWVKEGAKNN